MKMTNADTKIKLACNLVCHLTCQLTDREQMTLLDGYKLLPSSKDNHAAWEISRSIEWVGSTRVCWGPGQYATLMLWHMLASYPETTGNKLTLNDISDHPMLNWQDKLGKLVNLAPGRIHWTTNVAQTFRFLNPINFYSYRKLHSSVIAILRWARNHALQ